VRCSAIHQMNRVNSRNDLWSWWQHYKYRPGIIIIILHPNTPRFNSIWSYRLNGPKREM